jgi:hypothetical protein
MALADDFYQDQRKANRRIAELLATEGRSSAPTSSHLVGANRVLQGLLGGVMMNRADAADKARQDRITAALAGMPGLGGETEGIPASAAGPIYGSDFSTRAPDGTDRSISAGPRSPSFGPVTTASPEPPVTPSPYKLAGMPSPTNSQDTFRTPLDAMSPREQGLSALRTAMGGQPPMMGATPPGAIPVPTQAIRPPAPAAPPPMALAPTAAPPAAAAGLGIDPAQAKYIKGLMTSGEPQLQEYGMKLYQAAQQRALTLAAEKPTFEEIGIDPQTGQPVKGFVDSRRRSIEPYQLPAATGGAPSTIPPVPPGIDPKVWREAHSKRAAGEAMPGTSEDAMKLRKEVQDLPSYKNLAQSAPVYKSMLEAAGRDTRASDVNLIYGMAKLMDPGSVVRESEMSVAQAIATLPQNLQAQIKSQVTAGGRLPPEVRAGIMEEAYSRINAYRGMFDQDAGMFREIAKSGRFNEAHVLPNFGEFKPFTPPVAGAPTADDAIAELRRRKLIP